MTDSRRQYEMIGGPFDGSVANEPKSKGADYWYWQLPGTGHYAIYRWEGFRWKFVEIIKNKPTKYKG